MKSLEICQDLAFIIYLNLWLNTDQNSYEIICQVLHIFLSPIVLSMMMLSKNSITLSVTISVIT